MAGDGQRQAGNALTRHFGFHVAIDFGDDLVGCRGAHREQAVRHRHEARGHRGNNEQGTHIEHCRSRPEGVRQTLYNAGP